MFGITHVFAVEVFMLVSGLIGYYIGKKGFKGVKDEVKSVITPAPALTSIQAPVTEVQP